MKNLQKLRIMMQYFALIIFTLHSGMICIKKKNMPPATQSGANTFGCYVNNKIYIPQVPFILVTLSPPKKPLMAHYYEDPNDPSKSYFSIYTTDKINSPKRTLDIKAYGFNLEEMMYDISDNNSSNSFQAKFYYNSFLEYYSTPNSGKLTITHLDKVQRIVSGTFWFTALNQNNEIVEIKDGRFDIKY